MTATIKIKMHDNATMPERHGEMIDLAASETVELKKGDVTIVPFGVSMELPPDTFAMVFPRSSTCLKHGIIMANSVGVIEHDYCGDGDIWGFVAYAVRDTIIEKGTRIAQFALFNQMVDVDFREVKTLGNVNRGGYGSTGEKAEEVAPDSLQKLRDDVAALSCDGGSCAYFHQPYEGVEYCNVECPARKSLKPCRDVVYDDIVSRIGAMIDKN